jgi:membrane fusion protein, copper/silver efflux system
MKVQNSLTRRIHAPAFIRSSVLVAGLCAVFACSKAAQSDGSPSLVPVAAAAEKQPSAADKDIVAVLNVYETLRSALATDELSAAQSAAKQLADAATTASKSGKNATAVKAIAEAALAEAALPTTDPTAVRKQFGEVSRHLIALLISDAKLQQGRFIFECPMAPGYRKWVQTQPGVSNPYMGKKMLECGSSSSWTN